MTLQRLSTALQDIDRLNIDELQQLLRDTQNEYEVKVGRLRRFALGVHLSSRSQLPLGNRIERILSWMEHTRKLSRNREFRNVFRIEQVVFYELHARLQLYPLQDIHSSRYRQTDITVQLAIFLYRICRGATLFQTAETFGVSEGSIFNYTDRISSALLVVLRSEMSLPEKDEAVADSSHKFASLGFPFCMGIIGNTFLRIAPPKIPNKVYICRKHFFALNTQIVVNFDHRIIDVYAQSPGSMHESFVLHASPFWNTIDELTRRGTHYFLGSSCFRNCKYLITPHSLSSASPHHHVVFNHRHREAFQRLEQTIGQLKRRFRILRSALDIRSASTPQDIIIVCCLIHNFCISMNDRVGALIEEDIADQHSITVSDAEGDLIREKLSEAHAHEDGLATSSLLAADPHI